RAEHHANFVPWQQLARETGSPFLIAELTADKRAVNLDHYAELLKKHRPSVVAFSSSSNVLGNRHPWREMARLAKAEGALVFLDLAQSVAHDPVDLSRESELLDFVVLSGHKVFGPTGIGVLWGKEEFLSQWEPTHFGGDMISHVGDAETTWNVLPWKWEPGTPPIVEAVGFGAAVEYLTSTFDFGEIHDFETALCTRALSGLQEIEGLEIYGTLDASQRGPLVAFNLKGVHSLDLATWLDQRSLALRSGHHCAQPLHRALGVESSLRASFSIYNDQDDVEALLRGVSDAANFFARLRKKKEHKS
ncbi:MAG TPA: aminotransferase class V-fold PLP-dependent enzyme, partial [Bdellovibrionota bacterium]|nr:aminotransferase class V-fold PLP-dependent enzyme [Bdellovibrionota bacterium]